MQQPAAADDQQNEGTDQRQDFKSIPASEIIAAGPVVLLGSNQWRYGLRDGLGGFMLHGRSRVLVTGFWMLDKGIALVLCSHWLMRRLVSFFFIESTEYLS